jgi:HAD superfamily hydrolase (TIGR01509 family)
VETTPTLPLAWQQLDMLLLDMDGTLLDLAFDNYFWLELVPRRYAASANLPQPAAAAELRRRYDRIAGSLEWYCLDHWSEQLGIDILALKHEHRHMIGYLPGAVDFLRHVRASGKRIALVTNAHPDALALKLRQTHLDRFVDAVVSSHTVGHAKESQEFWPCLQAQLAFDPTRSLLVDDSVTVIRAAERAGLRHTLTVACPDSRQPRRHVESGRVVDAVGDLVPPPA